MTDYSAVLSALYRDAQWSLDGDDYAGLTWLDDSPKPTQAELDAAWPQVEWDRQVAAIRAEREARYRAETDPMFMKVQRGEGGTLEEWTDAVNAIRDELPYPPVP